MTQKNAMPTETEDDAAIKEAMTLASLGPSFKKHHPQTLVAVTNLAAEIGEYEAVKYARAILLMDHQRILGSVVTRMAPMLTMLVEPLMAEQVELCMSLGLKRKHMVTLATSMKQDLEDRDDQPRIVTL